MKCLKILKLLNFITYVNDCINFQQITHQITQQKMQNNITIYLFMSRKPWSFYIIKLTFSLHKAWLNFSTLYICTWHLALVQQACPVVPWRTSDWSLHWWLIVSCTQGQSHPRGLAWLSFCELYAPQKIQHPNKDKEGNIMILTD